MIFYECVEKFAEMSGRTKTESKEICDQILGMIMQTLLDGESINIYGFGTLEPYQTTERMVKTFDGTIKTSRPKTRVRFRLGSAFCRKLNGGEDIE